MNDRPVSCGNVAKEECLGEILGNIESLAHALEARADRLESFVNGDVPCCEEAALSPNGAYARMRTVRSNLESAAKHFDDLLAKLGV
jgi:plasmid maintenance system antidote protein VapI